MQHSAVVLLFAALYLLIPLDCCGSVPKLQPGDQAADFRELIVDLTTAIAQNPDAGELFRQRAVCWMHLSEYAKAISDYSDSIRIDPYSAHTYDRRGDCWRELDVEKKAIEDYEKGVAICSLSIRQYPDNPSGYEWRGSLLIKCNKLEDALADLAKASQLDPHYPIVYVHMGDCLRLQGDHGRAIEMYGKGIDLFRFNKNKETFSPDHRKVQLARAYHQRAIAWKSSPVAGSRAKALIDYENARKVWPEDLQSLIECGNELAEGGDFIQARGYYDYVLQVMQGYALPYICRGRLSMLEGNAKQAIADFNQAVNIAPKSYDAYLARAEAWRAMQDHTNVLADLERAIQLRPSRPAPYNGVSWLMSTTNDDSVRDGKRAVEFAVQACELSSWKSDNYLATLAAAYAESGDYISAQVRLQQAIDLAPHQDVELRGKMMQLFRDERPHRQE